MPKPKTGAQRQAAYKASGLKVTCVVRDPKALSALGRLVAQYGGVTAAITEALKRAGA